MHTNSYTGPRLHAAVAFCIFKHLNGQMLVRRWSTAFDFNDDKPCGDRQIGRGNRRFFLYSCKTVL